MAFFQTDTRYKQQLSQQTDDVLTFSRIVAKTSIKIVCIIVTIDIYN